MTAGSLDHVRPVAWAKHRDHRSLEARTSGDLWMKAELLMYGAADGRERMRELMELSDRFGRPIELERAFIGGVLRTPASDRGNDDPKISSRFQGALTSFEERFPGAGGLQTITVDPDGDPASLIDKLSELQPPETQERVDARQDAIDGLRQGRVPVAFVSGLVGRGIAEVLVRNMAYPLAVFDPETAEAEVGAAGAALDRAGAIWDETACITVAQIPAEAARRIESLLPRSHIGQAARNALADAVRAQMGGEQVAVMQILPDGTPRIVEERPETVAKVREVQTGADAIASRLTPSPDVTDGADDQLGMLVRRNQGRDPIAAMASALLAARTHGVPLFSDDRVVRAYARQLGLPAFGSIALIDAALRRGLFNDAEADRILKSIIDLGVWGAALDPAAYVDVARRAQFDLERCGRPLLADEALLRVDNRLLHNARLLGAIADEAPERLCDWATVIVQGYRELLQLAPTLVASLLIAAQLDPNASSVPEQLRARNISVIAALRSAVGHDPSDPGSDPLPGAISRWLHMTTNPEDHATTLESLLAQVDPDDEVGLRAQLS